MNPQVGIGLPFDPLRIGPDGLSFELCGTMLKVAPVLTKKLSFEISSFKKSKLAFVGNDIAVAAWIYCPPSLVGSADFSIFRLVARGNALVCPYTIVIVKLAQTVVQVSEVLKTDWVGGATF